MTLEVLATLMLVAFFVLLLIGIPVGLTLAATGFVFGYLGFGPALFNLLPHRIYGVVTNYTLLAIPLFVFMGVMLEKSKLAEELMDVIGLAAGSLKGGLGIGIILVGVLMGATTGIVGATVVTLGLLTLPGLLRRGYDKGLACGVICASGTLGQIIPPSLILILLADITNQSVGTVFAAAMVPGLMLSGIYIVYILILGMIRPDMVPAVPAEERAAISGMQLTGKIVRVVAPPIGLVIAVLGSIVAGIAAPSEAAAMGALGSILVAAFGRRLTITVLRETVQATTRITAMVMFILICAQVFSLAFRGLQGERLVQDAFTLLPGGINASIWFLMALIFVLGFFIEWIEISYIAVPLFLPIFIHANTDLVWLSTLICVNLQTSFLTPPFGWSLFFLRGVAPPEVTTGDIYRGIIPFVLMQLMALILVFFFPGLATWLPKAIGW
ncbi:MAG: TRAP transporter large permease subunit [Proteobacteria bacterium]|nr:TRAP transporter large permease subunit [Pseudomonadota bacterium]